MSQLLAQSLAACRGCTATDVPLSRTRGSCCVPDPSLSDEFPLKCVYLTSSRGTPPG